ncbi:MAG: hypothetical protein ROR55_04195 [Devosia sp.]
MVRALLILLLAGVLVGCDSPRLTGVSAGLGERLALPAGPTVPPESATFYFEPFPGMPGNIADDLTRKMWRRAEREGLTVVKRPGGPAIYTIDGVLTATSDDTNLVIFYVFDVKDVTGKRIHRIAGEQTADRSGSDPWAGVDAVELDLIARRVVALLRAWLYSDS